MESLYRSSNEAQVALCRSVLSSGLNAAPRGLNTKEVLGASFVITHPRNRLTTIPGRKWNASLAVAELAWNLRGEQAVDPLAFYVPRWREFADEDGRLRGSCYGASIFCATSGSSSQWEQVRTLLQNDPDSRRAVISLRRESDVSASTKDLSCTNTVQFIARRGRLHAFINMRSNDAIWGVPYDIFLFSTFHEMMALQLGLDLGDYHHYAASLHIYERHFKLATMIADVETARLDDGKMPAIQSVQSLFELAKTETAIRSGKVRASELHARTPYEKICLELLGKSSALAA
jgi:thymidylate synthase